MISWSEKAPDFSIQPIGRLFKRLPFNIASVVYLSRSRGPFIFFDGRAMSGVKAHLREENVELGGLLLGSVFAFDEPNGAFVVEISDFVRSDEADSTGVSLRMSTEVWNLARSRSVEGKSVVGWYHSHPNLGVFFSGTDRHTQRSFFNLPHSLGLVIDPIRREQKVFISAESLEVPECQMIETNSSDANSSSNG